METSLTRALMADEEWTFFVRFILTVRAPNGRKPINHRLVLDGIFWIARTGAPWRDPPEEFGKTALSFALIIRRRAQKGGSAPGFWPFSRWLHDQDPPPR